MSRQQTLIKGKKMRILLLINLLVLACGKEQKSDLQTPKTVKSIGEPEPKVLFVTGLKFRMFGSELIATVNSNEGANSHWAVIAWRYGDTEPKNCNKSSIVSESAMGRARAEVFLGSFHSHDEITARACLVDQNGNYTKGITKKYTVPKNPLTDTLNPRPSTKTDIKATKITGANLHFQDFGDYGTLLEIEVSVTEMRGDEKTAVAWDYGSEAPKECTAENTTPSDKNSSFLSYSTIRIKDTFNIDEQIALRFCVLYADGTYSEGITKTYTVK